MESNAGAIRCRAEVDDFMGRVTQSLYCLPIQETHHYTREDCSVRVDLGPFADLKDLAKQGLYEGTIGCSTALVWTKKVDAVLKVVIAFKGASEELLKLRVRCGERKISAKHCQTTYDSEWGILKVEIITLRESILLRQYSLSSQFDSCVLSANHLGPSTFTELRCAACHGVILKASEASRPFRLIHGEGYVDNEELKGDFPILGDSFCDHNPHAHIALNALTKAEPEAGLAAETSSSTQARPHICIEHASGLLFVNASDAFMLQKSTPAIESSRCKGCGTILGFKLGSSHLHALALDLVELGSVAVDSKVVLKQLLSEHMLASGIAGELHIIALRQPPSTMALKLKVLSCVTEAICWTLPRHPQKTIAEPHKAWKILYALQSGLTDVMIDTLVTVGNARLVSSQLYDLLLGLLATTSEPVSSTLFQCYLTLL